MCNLGPTIILRGLKKNIKKYHFFEHVYSIENPFKLIKF